jgi:hypothetical protein
VHRVAWGGRVELRAALIVYALIAIVAADTVHARPLRVFAFGTPPVAAYLAQLNGVTLQTVGSTPRGTLECRFDVPSRSTVSFVPANVSPPPPPTVFSAGINGAGCLEMRWFPSVDPTVVGNILYVGTRSVATGQASQYDYSYYVSRATQLQLCTLPPGTVYVALRARNAAGVFSAYSQEIRVNPGSGLAPLSPLTQPVYETALGQNIPNPFNPTTQIPFTLAQAGEVSVRIYDVRGALVATPHSGELGAGVHSVNWDGRDNSGRPVASGMYVYTLTAGGNRFKKKMMLLK